MEISLQPENDENGRFQFVGRDAGPNRIHVGRHVRQLLQLLRGHRRGITRRLRRAPLQNKYQICIFPKVKLF